MNVSLFPIINVSLNALAGIFLFLGWREIRRGNKEKHKNLMITAFVCSVVFLCSYLTYHYLKQGMVTRYEKEGILRIIYFAILITHTPLAALVPPFAIAALYQALKQNYVTHKLITKWLYPVWMYVSVTGVLIYLMLYVF